MALDERPFVLDPHEALHDASDALSALVEGLQTLGRPLPPALKPFGDRAPIWLETAVAVP